MLQSDNQKSHPEVDYDQFSENNENSDLFPNQDDFPPPISKIKMMKKMANLVPRDLHVQVDCTFACAIMGTKKICYFSQKKVQ